MKGRDAAGVLGGGSWGTTVAWLLASKGHETLQWVRDPAVRREIQEGRTNTRYLGEGLRLPEALRAVDDLEEVARRSTVIYAAVPTKAMREVVRALGDHLSGDHVLVSCAKGLEAVTGTRMSEVLREETCCRKIGVLSGPNLAREVAAGQPAATVVASRYDEVIRRASELLVSPRFRVYGNRDVVGVEAGGALKNIIALASGMVRGLGQGDNTRALLMTRGLAEVSRYGVRLGADPLTFSGLAGAGDLIVTCSSPLSRNHQVGYRLGRGEGLEAILADLGQVAEGVNTTRVVHQQARVLDVEMPITDGMHRILFEGSTVEEVTRDLMTRPSRDEIDRVVLAT
ncbi:MAG: NAD(P)-dependent glycerol-3-phosphate dehydrogenase [Planctomycetes bacterium]|nr:NAD(P)-dependent glycerol-3-phosphate dehydrogenase [Planctomycetota bacterium]